MLFFLQEGEKGESCNLTTKEIFDTYFVLKQFFEKLSDASYFDNSVEQNSRIRAQLLPATPAEG